MAESNTILKATVGSTLYGTSIDGASSDRDEMGVCVEPIEAVLGFNEFEQFIYRSAAERTGVKDAKSQDGDLDLIIYGLKKFLRLATYGNPTVVQMLFIPKEFCSVRLPLGVELQGMAPYIVSRQAGKRFLGYMEAQRQRLLGERGQMKVTRTDLIEQYGHDTKYLMQVLRLGLQGIELLETGRMTFPMKEAAWLRDVRVGKVSLQEGLTRAGELERHLEDLLTSSPLDPTPDMDRVEKWLLEAYMKNWELCNDTGYPYPSPY